MLTSLNQGWTEGLAHTLASLHPLSATTTALQPLQTGPRPGKILSGRFWQKRRLLAEAAASTASVTTVFLFSPTARPHKLSFQPEGYWLQTGGIFGQSTRQGPRFRLISFRKRLQEETARLALYRPVT